MWREVVWAWPRRRATATASSRTAADSCVRHCLAAATGVGMKVGGGVVVWRNGDVVFVQKEQKKNNLMVKLCNKLIYTGIDDVVIKDIDSL